LADPAAEFALRQRLAHAAAQNCQQIQQPQVITDARSKRPAQGRRTEAQARQAQHAIDEAQATLVQQQTLETLAKQELERTWSLLKNGWATKELMDQRQQQLDAANAGLSAAEARVRETQHALDAAQHDAGIP